MSPSLPGPQRLDGKVTVVTGSARGIGRASARLFGLHGAHVFGIDKDEGANAQMAADLAAEGIHIDTLSADIADAAALQRAVAAVGNQVDHVDVLFNNAGVMEFATFDGSTPDEWQRELDVNLTGAYLSTTAFLPLLKRSPSAAIVNNASVDGLLGNPHLAFYSVSKAGMVAMTRVLAAELAPFNIRVNCVAPALIVGPDRFLQQNRVGLSLENLVNQTPLRRPGRPEEVATVALFFATDDSSYVTGAVLPVDGGRIQLTPGTL